MKIKKLKSLVVKRRKIEPNEIETAENGSIEGSENVIKY